ncbi:autotransporter outer membrane beta-barrel domain-containing protein [Deinococcus sp. 12RED42]|uniref:autotransporter outer membrane beta-barrel domain-containing protein n=1 Tax=Deinococcus sp. 12RED42 TaxID=2745872 RepID=UPI001E300B6E|nr:DUF11 domain-containing protein [Deinococcus sp. 12RED42]
MKRAITTLTAALLGSAAAQEIATSLPLTSVGNKLMWTVGDQDLRLIVGLSSRVQLDVYGAQFDPQDYRSDDYYGDENYSTERPKAPVSSTFTLVNADGQVVREQNFGVGAQDWQTFLNDDLPAGTYTLKVRTDGNGKNTFAFRLNSISAAVEADHLNVTIRSNDWVPALNVANPGGPMGIRMYDGDGPGELEAELRDAQGNAYPVKVSGQLQWDDIKVPEEAGNYTLYLRQPKDTYQYSNSVGFELTTGPIKIVTADTTGRLEIRAELVLPDETLPTQANVTVGEQTYDVRGAAGPFTVPVKEYPVTAEPIKGAEVTLNAPAVTVVKQQTARVDVQVKPSVNLNFVADRPEVCVGDVVTFTARATTEFERQTLPANLRVKLPEGFTAAGETTVTARVDAANPGVLTFEAKAEAAGSGTFTATLAPWNQTQDLKVQVLPTATQIELRRAPLPDTLAGETVTVSLTLKNTSGVPAPYTLTDAPGETLEALDPTSFSGELQPGEEKTLSYRARVRGDGGAQGQLNATLSSNCASQQVVTGVQTVQTPPPPAPTPVVSVTRESNVRIPFDVPSTKNANQVIVAHQPPAGATYVPGSSQLSGRPIADPQAGPSGRYYWTTPGAARGVLTYRVTHEGNLPALSSPTLVGRYAGGVLNVLVGDGNLDDLNNLSGVTAPAAAPENAGALKLPLDGTVYRERDRITVAVESPADSAALPSVNGVPVDPATLGRKSVDAATGTQRQEFYGLPLRTGENTVTFGDQTVRVFLAGTPVRADLKAQQLIADGVTPIRIAVRLTDAAGLTTASSNVTVQTSLEPTQGDARPRVGSYQVKLVDGEGVLELEPLSAPTRFDVRLLLGDKVVIRSFEALPSKTRVGIGMVSLGAILQGGGIAAGEARGQAYLETPVGDGKLYVAASGAVNADRSAAGVTSVTQDRTQGLPTSSPLDRYPNMGDSSSESFPLQGIDPVAVRYEHPAFNVQYRQAPLPVDVFNLGITPTALSGFTRSNPQVSGFVAALPGDLVRRTLAAPGTRVLTLPDSGLQPDSETVELVTTDPRTGEQSVRTLARLTDYTLDASAGVLYFQRPVDLVDSEGRDQQVRLSYRLNDPLGARTLAWGVQGTYRVSDALSASAAAVQLDGVTSVGVRARYRADQSRADLLAAYAGGGVLVDAGASLTGERLGVNASLHYQGEDYSGLNASAAGLGVTADASYKLTDRLSIAAAAAYSSTPGTDGAAGTSGGRADLKGLYSFSPFTLGAGIRAGFGDQQGAAGLLSAAYTQGGLSVSAEHAQALSSTLDSTTTLKASVPVAENVTLTARDDINWAEGHRASLGLQSRLGMTNLNVHYDLPGADGWGNRARFGADTALPLNDTTSLGLNGSYVLDLDGNAENTGGWNAGVALRYKTDSLSGTLAADAATTGGTTTGGNFSVALKGGASYRLNEQLTLSADGTQVFGAGSGSNYAASAALRAGQWQGLAYLRYRDGALAGNTPELIGEANVEYHVPRYAVRAGIAGRSLLDQPGSATYQGSVSGTYYLTEQFGLGLAARGLIQPATGSSLLSLGLEGSYRALPGTWVTLGYNPVGFQGIGTNIYTRQGLYLRLDLMLDDGQPNGPNLSAPTSPPLPEEPATGGGD